MEGRYILMNITRGKIMSAKKVVIYGPEGIGKSTLAAKFPDPLFIDTEGSTKEMDVARLDKPTSWEFLLAELEFVRTQRPCKTLVIDTIDWAEQLCIKNICDKAGKTGIEDFGYGKGYVYEKETFQRLLTVLDGVIYAGINVVLTAHAALRKFEQPDELGAYDRWEMKLGAKTSNLISPLIKEWADMVLFANYKTISVAADKDGKKHKAQGGKRIMYTSHHPCWDAKNRYGLPEEIPMDYSAIQHILTDVPAPAPVNVQTAQPIQMQPTQPTQVQTAPEPSYIQEIPPDELPTTTSEPVQNVPTPSATADSSIPAGIPQALVDLMRVNNVSEYDIRKAVSSKGYFPFDTPITAYPPDFIEGCLIGAWNQVYQIIKDAYPFE